MKYYFLYRISDGSMYGAPYFGAAVEWTNIPSGCALIGPYEESHTTAADAFQHIEFYKVVDGTLTPVPNIAELKAAKEAEQKSQAQKPSLEKEIENLRNQVAQQNIDNLAFTEMILQSLGV